MKRFHRAVVLFLAAALILSLLSGCKKDPAGQQKQLVPERLTVCLGAAPVSLDPAYATEPGDLTLISHLYENLMKLSVDENGSTVAVPAIAKSYTAEKNVDGSVTYTFRLRSARWSDGSVVNADDFVYAWRRVADPATASPHSRLLSLVKGYDDVQATGNPAALQIRSRSTSILEITLTGTCEWFLTDVCTAPALSPLREDVIRKLQELTTPTPTEDSAAPAETPAPDAWASCYTLLACNGPYFIDSADNKSMTLAASERYSEDISVPKTLRVLYADSPEEGWSLYESGKVDFLAELPETRLRQLTENSESALLPLPTTGVLLINTTQENLSDVLVRDALHLSIDRTAISKAAGAACFPATGLVSPSVPDADEDADNFRAHGGILVDCDPEGTETRRSDARQILEGAGYDLEHLLPPMDLLHPDTERHAEIARLLAEMWASALGVSVTPVAMESAQLEAALSSRQFALALTDITAWVNDAQGFLNYWTTDDAANVVGYSNSAFDTLMAIVSSASDDAARRGCLHDAESLLMEDFPLSPLYFTGTAYALRENLTGLVRDARGTFRFADIRQSLLPQAPVTPAS